MEGVFRKLKKISQINRTSTVVKGLNKSASNSKANSLKAWIRDTGKDRSSARTRTLNTHIHTARSYGKVEMFAFI